MSEILRNSIKTPDGTVLVSRSRYDYTTHKDSVTGETYIIDGGLDYFRGSVNDVEAEDLSLTTDNSIEEIREGFEWGSRGEDGDQPLTYTPLKGLSDSHIQAILDTQSQLSELRLKMFSDELEYRRSLGIIVEDS